MNQLTEEQREQVKQIRERQYNRSVGKLSARELEIFKDVESLLSLLDSQPTAGSSVSTILGYEAGYSDGRDACVSRLKQIAADYDNVNQPNNGAAISKQAVLYAARQIEPLTLDQVQEKRK